jgi:polyisoprenyl-phosphate glycosyltransferase
MAPRARPETLLSVVAAVYNEEACLREFVARLDRAVVAASCPAEFVLVDDGSTDATFRIIEELAARDTRVRGIRLARNEGHQNALMCGMACARGDVLVTIDADLQHPPEHIPEMLEAWRQGFDVVHMHRRADGQSPLRMALAAAFYTIFNAVSDVDVPPRSTDFRLLDRACLDALTHEWRKQQFLRAAARRIGFRQTELAFDAPARFAGQSSYTLPKLVGLASRAVVAAVREKVALHPPSSLDPGPRGGNGMSKQTTDHTLPRRPS